MKSSVAGGGEGGKAGKPIDFVLMPPIHDAVLCYHDMIGQI